MDLDFFLYCTKSLQIGKQEIHFAEAVREKLLLGCLSILNFLSNWKSLLFQLWTVLDSKFSTIVFSVRMEIPCFYRAYTRIRTHTRTYLCVHIHEHTYKQTPAQIRTHSHLHALARTHTITQPHALKIASTHIARTRTYSPSHAPTLSRTRTHSYRCTHSHNRTHSHSYALTLHGHTRTHSHPLARTNSHRCTHPHRCTYPHRCTDSHLHAVTLARSHSHVLTLAYTCTLAHLQACSHAGILKIAHTPSQSHAHTRINTRACTCINMQKWIIFTILYITLVKPSENNSRWARLRLMQWFYRWAATSQLWVGLQPRLFCRKSSARSPDKAINNYSSTTNKGWPKKLLKIQTKVLNIYFEKYNLFACSGCPMLLLDRQFIILLPLTKELQAEHKFFSKIRP